MSNLEPVTAAVAEEALPEGYSIHDVMALIRDVVMNLHDLDVILKKHKITQAQYDRISKNEYFEQAYQYALKEWHSPNSTEKRVAMASAAIIEGGMHKMAARMYNPQEPLREVIEAMKLFAKMAGIGEKENQIGGAERFTITINLGGDQQLQYKQQSPTVELQAVPAISQGPSTDI